ncbi:MAG: hypothetical protein COV52_07535 [Gammaproteobacteria bacterium CG11_big_fil_rev_8_21_14_0_20_46_22]|nr:MAG: hypothetical protein COW05_06775 [Gammaproteobacteria bacterium CG12_big_fil_rev_8_21_14_0_65_46_12]PIR10734.1 MAG: hypothetical protein COV52_07535 [Gammaproteobacteria bacterium CG11_big_fil_rev_8_21_14_0_20_46_22]
MPGQTPNFQSPYSNPFLDSLSSANRDQIAIIEDKTKISYQTLGDRVRSTAEKIATLVAEHQRRPNTLAQAKKETVIGLYFKPSIDYIVLLLACWQAGVAFCPLDPTISSTDQQRLERQIACLNPDIIICPDQKDALFLEVDSPQHLTLSALNKLAPSSIPESAKSTDALAYVIATSGTTGESKGIEVMHKNITTTLKTAASIISKQKGQRFLQFARSGFDASLYEILVCILAEGTLVITPEKLKLSPERLSLFISDERIQHLTLVPSILERLSNVIIAAGKVETIVCMGEPLRPHILETWLDIPERFYNGYGLTETGIANLLWLMKRNQKHPESFYLCPPSDFRIEAGELVIYGHAVARGERDRPFHGRFCTGDYFSRNTFLPEGRIRPGQLKIAGQKVHPEAIEAATRAFFISKSLELKSVKYRITDKNCFHLEIDLIGHFLDSALAEALHKSLSSTGLNGIPALHQIHDTRRQFNPINECEKNSTINPEILEAWQETLSIDCVEPETVFQDCGGNSLNFMCLCNKLNPTEMQRHLLLRAFSGSTLTPSLIQQVLHQATPTPKTSDTLVVFLPGLSNDPIAFEKLARKISHHADTLCATLPDQIEETSVENVAQAVIAREKTILSGYENIILVGWSYGGLIALEMAKVLKERVPTQTILLDTIDHHDKFSRLNQTQAASLIRGLCLFVHKLMLAYYPSGDQELSLNPLFRLKNLNVEALQWSSTYAHRIFSSLIQPTQSLEQAAYIRNALYYFLSSLNYRTDPETLRTIKATLIQASPTESKTAWPKKTKSAFEVVAAVPSCSHFEIAQHETTHSTILRAIRLSQPLFSALSLGKPPSSPELRREFEGDQCLELPKRNSQTNLPNFFNSRVNDGSQNKYDPTKTYQQAL